MSPAFDEMHTRAGAARPHYHGYESWLGSQSPETMANKRAEADLVFRRVGITFAVYGEAAGTERLIPFDVIPRIIPAHEWLQLEAGLRQRVRALNMFLHDVYHGQDIIRAGKVPAEQVFRNSQYRPEMHGIDVASGIYSHIAGIDIVRAGEGEYYVLEDNLRVPSGVSYMLENRKMMMRLFPDLFARNKVAPVAHYPDVLLENLRSVAPQGVDDPVVVVLTPGMYNSAYFEHAFLSQQMGVELVEGQDLFVQDNAVFMRTTRGPQRVDVIYRRIDDDFLDPLVFRPDSTLGVPGLLAAYRAGRVTLANAIGTGIADDKSIYPYVPDMIRVLSRRGAAAGQRADLQVPQPRRAGSTCWRTCAELVVKEVHGAGGYGMLVGPRGDESGSRGLPRQDPQGPGQLHRPADAGAVDLPDLRRLAASRRATSTCGRSCCRAGRSRIVPGGLTRVALREGSLVVNSSQGGGTKDTWVLEG